MNVTWDARGYERDFGARGLTYEPLRDGTWHADYVRLRMRAVKVQ